MNRIELLKQSIAAVGEKRSTAVVQLSMAKSINNLDLVTYWQGEHDQHSKTYAGLLVWFQEVNCEKS